MGVYARMGWSFLILSELPLADLTAIVRVGAPQDRPASAPALLRLWWCTVANVADWGLIVVVVVAHVCAHRDLRSQQMNPYHAYLWWNASGVTTISRLQ